MGTLRTLSLVSLLAVGGCVGSFGSDTGDRFGQPTDTGEVPTPSCPIDPDCAIGGDCSLYECPEYWICEDLPNGRKRCIAPGPDYPDDGGGWSCEDIGGETVCTRPGSTFPDDGGGGQWRCEQQGDLIRCSDSTPDYPDAGGGGPYDCWYADEFRICETTPPTTGDGGGWVCYDTTSGRECRQNSPRYPDDRSWECWDADGSTLCRTPGTSLPDDGGGGEWVCESRGEFVTCRDETPDYPDEGGGAPYDCTFADEWRICRPEAPVTPDGGGGVCVPGTLRWCDDAVYCSWGKQTCLPDGTWGRCIEPSLSRTGLSDRPDTACGCRFFYFNDECCEDQADRDRDGAPDCIIPADHRPPACPSDGGLCSYCDSHTDCGGERDLCIFRPDGYAMCGRDCSTSGCPTGYACQTIGTRSGTVHQCVPSTGSCE